MEDYNSLDYFFKVFHEVLADPLRQPNPLRLLQLQACKQEQPEEMEVLQGESEKETINCGSRHAEYDEGNSQIKPSTCKPEQSEKMVPHLDAYVKERNAKRHAENEAQEAQKTKMKRTN